MEAEEEGERKKAEPPGLEEFKKQLLLAWGKLSVEDALKVADYLLKCFKHSATEES